MKNETTLFPTGYALPCFGENALPGCVLAKGGTIGSAESGATERAHQDVEKLYVLLWNNISDEFCPVIGGRGTSAEEDFAANKPITVPDLRDGASALYSIAL